jgi:hypothetical protein
MITGTRLIALALAIFAAQATPALAAEWGLGELMRGLSQVKAVKAKFVERKHVAVLTAPLEMSGTLEYEAPGRLIKTTLKPEPEKMTLENDRLTVETRKGTQTQRRTLSLRDYPALWALVECIRGTLAGDLAALQRFYQVELEGGESKWRLVLKPIDPAVQAYLKEMRITGSADWISGIEILQSDGDRSVMQISRAGA